jgi:hypothetical protein
VDRYCQGENPKPVPFCPPQTPNGLAWDRSRTSTVADWRPTVWVITRINKVSQTSRFEWTQNRLHARELQNALCKQYASLATKSGTCIGAVCHNRDSALNTNKTTVAHRDSIQQAFTVFYLDRTQGRLKMRWLCNKTFLESRCIATASLYRDC